MFVVTVFSLLLCTVSGGIVEGPENVAMEYGPALVLHCEASAPTARIVWAEFVTNPTGAPISDGNFTLGGHPNSARYQILHPTPTTYDLKIEPTVIADGGRYRCYDTNEPNPPADMELIMIEGMPNCTSNIPDSGPYTGYVREGVYYTEECTVTYRGNVAPRMTWTSVPDPHQEATVTTNVTVWSGVSVNMTRFMEGDYFEVLVNFTQDGFQQPDSATNVPTWNYTYSSPELYVQWSPTAMYIVPEQATYEIGQTIECHADANPEATFFWQNLDTTETWNDFRLYVSDALIGSQRMRCNARNNITGITFTNDFFLNLTVNPRTTTPIPTTTTTTTPVPAELPCDDLTGRWTAQQPHLVDMCLDVNNTNFGRVVGILRNATDPYFVEIRGRVSPNKFNQIGLSGIWPVDIGTLSFNGICKKCMGVERLQMNGIVRKVTDNPSCEDPGPIYKIEDYEFVRTGGPCRGLVQHELSRTYHQRA